MGAALTKLCCCCQGLQRRRTKWGPALLAPSLAPSWGSSPSPTESFFSADSYPEQPPMSLHPRASLAPAPSGIVILSTSPLAVLIPNFMTLNECNALIALSQPHLRPSKVCGAGVCPADRNSSSLFFKAPWTTHAPQVAAFETKAAHIASAAAAALGRAPLTPVQAAQVVRYSVGQFYAQHHDNVPESCTKRLQRAATLIVYLCDVEEGGETVFPLGRAAATVVGAEAPWGKGFEVQPRAGHALLFWSALPQAAGGGADPAAEHAAAMVEAGEKWIATRWFKEEEDDDDGISMGCCGGVID
jgi:prolyl 4-hydroxylase